MSDILNFYRFILLHSALSVYRNVGFVALMDVLNGELCWLKENQKYAHVKKRDIDSLLGI